MALMVKLALRVIGFCLSLSALLLVAITILYAHLYGPVVIVFPLGEGPFEFAITLTAIIIVVYVFAHDLRSYVSPHRNT